MEFVTFNRYNYFSGFWGFAQTTRGALSMYGPRW